MQQILDAGRICGIGRLCASDRDPRTEKQQFMLGPQARKRTTSPAAASGATMLRTSRARRAAGRWVREGRRVRLVIPYRTGADPNDLLRDAHHAA